MIKKERVQRGRIDEEYVRLTITGKVDDILHKKVPVKLEEIFKLDEKERKVILIEGAPGSGKSTLSWDICQRWDAGKLFQEYKAVVLVQIRDPEAQKACEIVELLPAQDRSMAESVAAGIVACRGRKILFVIDGWDEGGSSLPETSAIRRLIQPELCCQENPLYESSVIVTSRPISSGDLQPLASSRIEIVGFTPAELKQYFSECLEGDCRAVDKLLERIQEHPEVEGSCYLPLNAAIIVHLFLSEGQTIPSTQYGIFSAVVLNCILRHLKQRTEEGRQIECLESICSLPEAIREPFKNVCKLAYHGVVENKITFSQDDLAAVGIPTSVPLLGLLQAVKSLVSSGRRVSFNFIHLSIQELLAAFCISQLPSSQQISVFQQLFREPRFHAIFQFYAAITKLQNPGIQSIITRILQKENLDGAEDLNDEENPDDYIPLVVPLLNCLFEAQDLSLCQFVAEQLNGNLDLHETTLTPLDCLSVGYFLSCVCVTTSGEFEVDLSDCSIDEHKCRLLVRCLCRCPAPNSTVTGWLHMDLEGNEIGQRGAQYIADVLQNTIIVHTLNLNPNTIQEYGMKYIIESLLTNCSLVTLVLNGVFLYHDCFLKITKESGPVLCQMLQRNNTLTDLDLTCNRDVSDTGAFFIAEGLKLNTSLQTLVLTQCGFSAEGAKFISGALEINASLKVIDLSDNKLGDTGVGYLADALKWNDSLKELYLEQCGMTDRGLELLVVAVTENKSLEVLDVCPNDSISIGGLSVLTVHLKRNTGLVKLHLPQQLLSGSKLQDTVNEARRSSGLSLIKVECELPEYQLEFSITRVLSMGGRRFPPSTPASPPQNFYQ